MSDYVSAMELGDEVPVPVVLVGNKSDVDLEDGGHVSRREYDTWVEDNHVVRFYDVSARNNTNIDDAVNGLVHHILSSNGSK